MPPHLKVNIKFIFVFHVCITDRVKLYGDPNELDDAATTILDELDSNSDIQSFKKSRSASDKLESHPNNPENSNDIGDIYQKKVNRMLTNNYNESADYTVILREHENNHHGHSHTHGHVHAAPKSMSSVAWMVS